jgi:ABC-type transport system involved in multi-copper enzyme maturation permease subunit
VNTRLLRYSRFQVPEFIQHRLALPLVLIAFTAGLPTYLATKNVPPGWMQSAQGINLAKQMFAQSITLFLPLGAFVAAIGVISADRQQGYFRFLFSKPVNVLAYYAQTYVLHAIVFVLTFGLIVWGFGAYTIHFSVHRSMEAALLTFVLIGGLGLLLGALTRYDGAGLIAIYVFALMLQQLMSAANGLKNGGLPDWLATLAKGLPPVGKLDHLRDHLYAGTTVDMAELWHVLGYGGGAALLGFILLRRLPLAR